MLRLIRQNQCIGVRSLRIGQHGPLLLLQLKLLLLLKLLKLSCLLLLELLLLLQLLLLQKQLMLLLLDLLALLRRLKLSGGCVKYIISARHAVILLLTPTCC